MKKAIPSLKNIRDKMREAAKESGMTQEEIGLAMGFSKSGARQAVSRLLNPDSDMDPRITTLIHFAAAVDCSLAEFLV